MRLNLNIKMGSYVIPFDHQHLLVGCIHKWLGWNEQHGELSLFSFSRLFGGKAKNNGLSFERNATFFVSAFDENVIKQLLKGIREDPTMFFGLVVSDVFIEDDPDLSNKERFFPGSPVLIKRRAEETIEHILYTDSRASQLLKETLLTKMEKVGLSDDAFEIYFDETFYQAKTMLINYRGVQNKTSWCPVIIKGSPEVKLLAWHVGLGNSTGIGFGAIK